MKQTVLLAAGALIAASFGVLATMTAKPVHLAGEEQGMGTDRSSATPAAHADTVPDQALRPGGVSRPVVRAPVAPKSQDQDLEAVQVEKGSSTGPVRVMPDLKKSDGTKAE